MEVLTDAQQLPPGHYLHDWWAAHKQAILSTSSACSLEDDAIYLPSRKALRARKRLQMPELPENPEQVREEWLVSTSGLALIMVVIATIFRKRAHKAAARGLLQALLAALLDGDCVTKHPSLQLDVATLRQCDAFSNQDDPCCEHMKLVFAALGNASAAAQARLADALLVAGPLVAICPATVAWLSAALAAFSEDIAEAIPRKACKGDVLQSRAACRNDEMKRRRIDEDLKKAVCTDMVVDGRADQARDGARLMGLGGATAAKWDEKELLNYQAACWKLCERSGCSLSVALDGKRIGQPAEETEVVAAWTWPQQVAFWLPPMVRGLASGRGPKRPQEVLGPGPGAPRGPSWSWAFVCGAVGAWRCLKVPRGV